MARNWAVCIGINEYSYRLSLNYAKRDAEAMSNWLKGKAEFEKVYLFTDDSPPIDDMSRPFPSQPTYITLRRWMGMRFKRRGQPLLSFEDNLWFFFSGHGKRYRDRDYLLLSDSDSSVEHIEQTSLSVNYITEYLCQSGAGNIILFIDACRDAAKGRGLELAHQQGIISISSCSPNELAYEIDELQNGSFTYALLESLSIGNCAMVERLYNRLRTRVKEINQQYGKPIQTPYAVIQPASRYHLILLPDQATLQDVAVLKMDAYEAEQEDAQLAEKLWTQVLTVSPADSDALKRLRRLWQDKEKEESQIRIQNLEQSITPKKQQREKQKQQEKKEQVNLNSRGRIAKNWAVCIGINHYVNMPDLRCAKRDAEKMQDWFKNAGFDKVYLFTDDSPPIEDPEQPYDSQPTGNILKRFFRVRFQPNTLSIEDNLWFFFSGHGLRYHGKDYLMSSDSDPDLEGVEETAIQISYITERLRGCGAGDVVIIYDACREQVTSKGLGIGEEHQKGVITLASCGPNEQSYEIYDPTIQQGSFTYALLEALENTQGGQGNYATFDRLYQRLRYRVPEINQQYGQPTIQHPYGFVEPDEKRYCILLPQHATDQDISTYKEQALNAEAEGNYDEAERLLTRLWEMRPGDPKIRQYRDRVIIKKADLLSQKDN